MMDLDAQKKLMRSLHGKHYDQPFVKDLDTPPSSTRTTPINSSPTGDAYSPRHHDKSVSSVGMIL